jgi:hypothetical protein
VAGRAQCYVRCSDTSEQHVLNDTQRTASVPDVATNMFTTTYSFYTIFWPTHNDA